MNIESIRALICSNPRTSLGYCQKVRDAAGRYAANRRDQGARWSSIETEVGVTGASLRVWMRALQGGGFHQVVVVEEASPAPHQGVTELVITSPSGFTLTGCTLEQAALVLERIR